MPTTEQEADTVVRICAEEGVKSEKLVRIFTRLWAEVGEISENDSVKQTMRMLKNMACIANKSEVVNRNDAVHRNVYVLLLVLIVLIHTLIWLAMLTSCVLSMIYQPWYIAFMVIAFAVSLLMTEEQCPITRYENALREKMGIQRINHFSIHYFKTIRETVRDLTDHRIGF